MLDSDGPAYSRQNLTHLSDPRYAPVSGQALAAEKLD